MPTRSVRIGESLYLEVAALAEVERRPIVAQLELLVRGALLRGVGDPGVGQTRAVSLEVEPPAPRRSVSDETLFPRIPVLRESPDPVGRKSFKPDFKK